MRTDHSAQITELRKKKVNVVDNRLAADLLEMHDRTSLSLDNWDSARKFVEGRVGPITSNGA